MKESKRILNITLNKNKCLFSYLYTLTFTLKGFKVIYYCTETSNMETAVNKECNNYMKQMLKTCENAYKIFYHIIFLDICKSYKIVLNGLYVKKDYCIGNPSTEFRCNLRKEKLDYQLRLCDMLIQENNRKLFKLEDDFGQAIKKTKVNVNFLFKLRFHFYRVEKKQQKIKLEKLRSLSPNSAYEKITFSIKLDFVKFCSSNIEDFKNLFKILTLDNIPGFIEKNKVPSNSVKNLVANRHLYLENNEREEVNRACNFAGGVLSEDNSNDYVVAQEIDDNRAKLKDNRLEGKFFSKNVISLSQRQLTKSEIPHLSKGLKSVLTPNRIDKANLNKS